MTISKIILLEQIGKSHTKPDKYPLPWNDRFNLAYWQINLFLIIYEEGWSKKQQYQSMSKIIPWINEWIEKEDKENVLR